MKAMRNMGKALATVGLAMSLASMPGVALAAEYSGSAVIEPSDSGVQLATIKTVEYGASWDYGSVPFVHGWSNLTSSKRWHSSTVTAGANSKTDTKGPGNTSKAELWLSAFSTYTAYYSIW